ncbi:MAG: DUF3153 domain-containing protein [Leptolyngbyaceae cyanobacterium SL_7_1]|nr:DUF3153 domain-containing protein [Leptolyngbyaceae cyanobacterium SL_7_1]
MIIPFNNGAELEEKFNQFFQPSAPTPSAEQAIELPEITSHLRLHETNFLLLLRNQIDYEIDLRSLRVLSRDDSPLGNANSLLNAQFRLFTPWGARRLEETGAEPPENPLTWQLQPGKVNHLNAVFWVPSPLGIGTLVIILLVAIGIFLQSWLFAPAPPFED